jgi:uncharacterized protein (DUF1800 family)
MLSSIRSLLSGGFLLLGTVVPGVFAQNAAVPAPGASIERRPVLFIATLRPTEDAPDSTGYGTATLLVSPDRGHTRVSVTYSNLTSTLVSAHLKLGAPLEDGAYLMAFYGGQPIVSEWDFPATGSFTGADLQKALINGLIYVAIDTKDHPGGELRGQFIRTNGSSFFIPPARPPDLPAGPPTQADAARFLIQATFGPTREQIDDLTKEGFDSWIRQQMAMGASSHLEATREDFRTYPPGPAEKAKEPRINSNNFQNAWWRIALTAPDQLRQRVAFALSEIFVISDVNGVVKRNPEGAANYYDMLARNAFGNYLTLLEEVTLNPMMGAYLNVFRNPKGDPAKRTSPDENYAREVMQLFTIGLNELQPDGTLRLGPDGMPIPTYDQHTITEMSRVFTGWAFNPSGRRPNFYGGPPDFIEPMALYPPLHDDGQKVIIGGIRIPPDMGGVADLRIALHALFLHPNAGPFLCRELIQRLVTSNPSPGYVYRVSQVFANDGAGVRGDLGAVIRAILLDYEARSPSVTHDIGYGKMKEPLLRVTALLRAFNGSAQNGRFFIPNPEYNLGQAALRSPTVFNFFEPDFVLPGTMAAAGLCAPEYEIFNANTAITIPNFLQRLIFTLPVPPEDTLTLKLDPILPLANSSDQLLDYLDLTLCGGSMGPDTRLRIGRALSALPPRAPELPRARLALQLTVTSPAAAIQH